MVKKTFNDPKQEKEEVKKKRIEHMLKIKELNPEDVIVIDEFGTHLTIMKEYARLLRVKGHMIQNRFIKGKT